MATEQQHTAQYQHNEAVAVQLEADPTNGDWVITLKFYTALHLIRTYLAREGHAREYKYPQISEMLLRLGVHADVRDAFRDFLDLSSKYRYRCQWPNVLQADLEEADAHLATIRQFVES